MTVAEERLAGDRAGLVPMATGLLARIRRRIAAVIPAIHPETLAIGRILFAGLILYFFTYTVGPANFGILARSEPVGDFTRWLDRGGLFSWLSAQPATGTVLYWLIVVCLVAVIAGFLVRLAWPLLTLGFWLFAILGNEGHFITPLLLAMTATIAAPWGAAWSLDAALFGRRWPARRSRVYGAPLWLLGLAIALTYAASGLAKLLVTDGEWLTETGARMGFVQDFRQAATDWGMILASHYWLSLLASVHAAFGQIAYIVVPFTRSPWLKLATLLVIALPFLIGLVLLMGLFWWPWGLLVLMLYLPWRWIDRRLEPLLARRGAASVGPAPRSQAGLTAAATGVLFGLFVYATLAEREFEPLFSNFPMYAQGLLGGSADEAEFWARYQGYDRNYRVGIVATTAAGERIDLSGWYHMGRALRHLAPQAATGLDGIVRPATAGAPVPPDACRRARDLAERHTGRTDLATLIVQKRYVDLVEGRMEWSSRHPEVVIDLHGSACVGR